MNENQNIKDILIIGAGSWGTALSYILSQKGYNIKIWSIEQSVIEDINNSHKNSKYTGDLILPINVCAFGTHDIRNFDGSYKPEIIIFAVPTQYVRNVATNLCNFLEEHSSKVVSIVNVAKGIEIVTNLRISQILSEVLPNNINKKIAVLSGPNISSEIIKKLPSVSTIASKNIKVNRLLQEVFSTDYFRVYTNDDLVGVELCGALKNIIAIATGISDGLGFGSNSKASLITRGLYELTKFGVKFGAKPKTFSGIAGMGDLITTCISPCSRNRYVGERLAKGEKIDNIIKSMYMIAEGIDTTKAVYEMSLKFDLELPITECVYNIIYNDTNVLDSVKSLMTRKFKSE